MLTATLCLTAFIALAAEAPPALQSPQDLRIDLPQDVRIALFGVPPVEKSQAALAGLREAIEEYDRAGTEGEADKIAQERAKIKICFRLGKLDETMTALAAKLQELQRFGGLEQYRDLARDVSLQSEALGSFCGDGLGVVVVEGGDEPVEPANAIDPVEQLKLDLDRLAETLARIQEVTRDDVARKARLEKDLGNVAQFVLQMKGIVEQIEQAKQTGQADVTIDSDQIVQGVQGLIEVIRDLKQEREARELRGTTEPRTQKRDRQRRLRVDGANTL